jgi:hypothetical protein
MAEMLVKSESLTSIADKIRVLKGTTESMSPDDMATELDTIPKNDSSDLTASGATVTVPAGYYASQATKSVATATQATPSVSIDSTGKITATATQTAGYVSAGTKTGMKQLTTQAAKTVTPSTSSQTAVASGVYTTGAVTVAAIPSKYVDNSTVTAIEADVLSGKKFGSTNSVKTGSMANNGAVSKTLDGVTTKSVTIPAGYTSGGTVSMDGTVDNAVTAALSALVEKGVEVPEGTNVTGLAALIAAIEIGGGDRLYTEVRTFTEDSNVRIGIYPGFGKCPNIFGYYCIDFDASQTTQPYINSCIWLVTGYTENDITAAYRWKSKTSTSYPSNSSAYINKEITNNPAGMVHYESSNDRVRFGITTSSSSNTYYYWQGGKTYVFFAGVL